MKRPAFWRFFYAPTPGNGRERTTRFSVEMESDVENQTSLDDLLSDKELPETTEETEQTEDTGVETSEETATAETEQETEEKAEPTPGEEAEQKTDDEEGPESWTKAAVLDERRKRQALEAELEKMRQGQQPATEPEKADWYADPEKAAQSMEQQLSRQAFNTKLELSQDMMRGQFEDYDELETEFVDLAKQDPRLVQEMQQAANPARFAYETAQKARKYAAMQDVEGYEAKVRQEIEAKVRKELEAEQQQKAEKQQQKRAAIDPSLASSTSGGLKSDDFAGPTPLEDILNG